MTTTKAVYIIKIMSSTITTSGFDSYKLQTTFHDENTVSHTGPELGHAVDIPPMALKRTWTREKELGIGSFGEVWREKEDESGELRAVKLIPKAILKAKKINYRDELEALVKVKDVNKNNKN